MKTDPGTSLRYFTASFSDRLVASGDLLRQDEKLEAVRALVKQVKHDHRHQLELITVHRHGHPSVDPTAASTAGASASLGLVHDVLTHFAARGGNGSTASQAGARSRLRVTFDGEDASDEGGLTTEMFRLFFEGLIDPRLGLFETCAQDNTSASGATAAAAAAAASLAGSSGGGGSGGGGAAYLPVCGALSAEKASRLAAVGRAMVKCFYEGRRVGSRFAPSFFK